MNTLENEYLSITVKDLGAELQSLRRKSDGEELLWQGDPTYWERRSPLLFPIVGHLYQDTLRIGGKPAHMTQHGFARDFPFDALIPYHENEMAFALYGPAPSIEEAYPFPYQLYIHYTLDGMKLHVQVRIVNGGHTDMPFQVGAHPAFRLPDYHDDDLVHGVLDFGVNHLVSEGLAPGGYIAPHTSFPVKLYDNALPLTNETFACDTIIDTRGLTPDILLREKDGRPRLMLSHSAPVLALWAPQGGRCPFVCIEPWEGLPDVDGYKGEFAQRPYTRTLKPDEHYDFRYTITVYE